MSFKYQIKQIDAVSSNPATARLQVYDTCKKFYQEHKRWPTHIGVGDWVSNFVQDFVTRYGGKILVGLKVPAMNIAWLACDKTEEPVTERPDFAAEYKGGNPLEVSNRDTSPSEDINDFELLYDQLLTGWKNVLKQNGIKEAQLTEVKEQPEPNVKPEPKYKPSTIKAGSKTRSKAKAKAKAKPKTRVEAKTKSKKRDKSQPKAKSSISQEQAEKLVKALLQYNPK